jgi:hypothetical protein
LNSRIVCENGWKRKRLSSDGDVMPISSKGLFESCAQKPFAFDGQSENQKVRFSVSLATFFMF